MFTFHSGKIKARTMQSAKIVVTVFTFHYGKIKIKQESFGLNLQQLFTIHSGKIKTQLPQRRRFVSNDIYIPLW